MRRVILLLAAVAVTLVVASGLALAVNKVGTNGPDTLRGTNGDDNLVGRGGNDDIFGLGGRDNLLGGEGKDNVFGGNERRPSEGDKNLVGGEGNDRVLGGTGSDKQVGGPGNDLVDGGPGADDITGGDGTDLVFDGEQRRGPTDRLVGGDGNDFLGPINAPAGRDLVVCGDGFDRVWVDRKDVVAPDCEKVILGVGSAQAEAFFGSIPQSFFEALPPFPEG
jgi:Ca2+-binding RTX toxin-like protein